MDLLCEESLFAKRRRVNSGYVKVCGYKRADFQILNTEDPAAVQLRWAIDTSESRESNEVEENTERKPNGIPPEAQAVETETASRPSTGETRDSPCETRTSSENAPVEAEDEPEHPTSPSAQSNRLSESISAPATSPAAPNKPPIPPEGPSIATSQRKIAPRTIPAGSFFNNEPTIRQSETSTDGILPLPNNVFACEYCWEANRGIIPRDYVAALVHRVFCDKNPDPSKHHSEYMSLFPSVEKQSAARARKNNSEAMTITWKSDIQSRKTTTVGASTDPPPEADDVIQIAAPVEKNGENNRPSQPQHQTMENKRDKSQEMLAQAMAKLENLGKKFEAESRRRLEEIRLREPELEKEKITVKGESPEPQLRPEPERPGPILEADQTTSDLPNPTKLKKKEEDRPKVIYWLKLSNREWVCRQCLEHGESPKKYRGRTWLGKHWMTCKYNENKGPHVPKAL